MNSLEGETTTTMASVSENHPAWQILAQKMSLDVILYEYIHELFYGEQKELMY